MSGPTVSAPTTTAQAMTPPTLRRWPPGAEAPGSSLEKPVETGSPQESAGTPNAGRFETGARRGCARVCLSVVFILLPLRVALAHSFAPAVLDLREFDAGRFDVLWKLPGLDSGSFADGVETPRPHLPTSCRDINAPPGAADSGPLYWRVDCGPAALRGETLWVNGLDGTRLDVIVRISWNDGTTTSAVLRRSDDHFLVPPGRGGASAGGVNHGATGGVAVGTVLWSYGRLGVAHILLGLDHLLFVLGLLLLVKSWRTLVKTISAFTVAHSLALALAVLGLVHVPAAPVEALIACSIVLVAFELTRAAQSPRTLTHEYPWVVAFAFGLLHGLGFAGALAEVGLPPEQIAVALVAFNVGVEIGQLAFVIAMMGPLAILARVTSTWPRTRLIPAYAIGVVATAWTFERIRQFWGS